MKILKISHLFILIILISGCSSIPKNTKRIDSVDLELKKELSKK